MRDGAEGRRVLEGMRHGGRGGRRAGRRPVKSTGRTVRIPPPLRADGGPVPAAPALGTDRTRRTGAQRHAVSGWVSQPLSASQGRLLPRRWADGILETGQGEEGYAEMRRDDTLRDGMDGWQVWAGREECPGVQEG